LRFLAGVVSLLLLALLLIFPGFAPWIAGLRPFDSPAGIDELPPTETPRAGIFLDERNEVVVRVPRSISVVEFLRLNQVDHPHVRQALARAMGRQTLGDDDILPAGLTITITLTPPASTR